MLSSLRFPFAICIRASNCRVIARNPSSKLLQGSVCYSNDASSSEQPSGSPSTKGRMMPFKEYRKLRKALKWQSRICGVPFALAGMAISAAVNVYLNPGMFEMAPEDVKPILWVWNALSIYCRSVSDLIWVTVRISLVYRENNGSLVHTCIQCSDATPQLCLLVCVLLKVSLKKCCAFKY